MEIKPVAYFRSPVKEKFGLPRQAGLAPDLIGQIVLEPEFQAPEALRGLEGFEFIWLLWGFNLNRTTSHGATVRPPRLGGNERIGVFASRSPFRPNPIGLSSVRIEGIKDGVITVSGADLADGSPIFDIKPYVPYTDSHPDAKDGFVHDRAWDSLEVIFPENIGDRGLARQDIAALREILEQDPRPQYHEDSDRIYGLSFAGLNIRFTVSEGTLTVLPD